MVKIPNSSNCDNNVDELDGPGLIINVVSLRTYDAFENRGPLTRRSVLDPAQLRKAPA